jgi:cyclopropane fatty-acyl-phospholipid synthase-like methyltransferase
LAPSSACRFCSAPLEEVVADLGVTPLANSYLAAEELYRMEPFYPLKAFVCDSCLLVQLQEVESPERIFSNYAYFSSFSTTWLEHSRRFAEAAIERLGLDTSSHVLEVASNDGYLLQYFRSRGIPVLGVEPAANVAQSALTRGIPTLVEFFGEECATRLAADWRADLIVANNVMPHAPDLNDFVAGLRTALADEGAITIEFQHLSKLMAENEFDTIYHEHFSYFSFLTASRVLAAHGLRAFDVEELPTHGGSLRVWACHEASEREEAEACRTLLARERAEGVDRIETYRSFERRVRQAKREILRFLVDLKDDGKSVAAYGAPAKGNTLLNYCGIGPDLIDYTVDRNPAKQGHYLPGTRIPIYPPERIAETRPDVVFILPWNLTREIVDQLAYVRDWGGCFAVRAPVLELIP